MELLKRIEKLVGQGYSQNFIDLTDKLEIKVKLPKTLQEKLDNLKDNPIDEPKVYKMLQDKVNMSKFAMHFFETKEELMELNAVDIGIFVKAVKDKVDSHHNEFGELKTTKNILNCDMPNIFEIEEMETIFLDTAMAKQEMDETTQSIAMSMAREGRKTLSDEEKKTQAAAYEKFTKSYEKTKRKCIKVSKLDGRTLSNWEKALVVLIMQEARRKVVTSGVGKQ